jgi:hypothetical protein
MRGWIMVFPDSIDFATPSLRGGTKIECPTHPQVERLISSI